MGGKCSLCEGQTSVAIVIIIKFNLVDSDTGKSSHPVRPVSQEHSTAKCGSYIFRAHPMRSREPFPEKSWLLLFLAELI